MPKARILAVDDQRYFRELIEEFLVEEGFEAQTASTGEEALHILENVDFDVVLTDLVMPGMDGTELVHRVKQHNAEQDIVVVTGVVDVKTAVDAMKLGASDYLLKPFDRKTLAMTLEGILQRRRLKTEHSRLLAENIEFIGERSLYERALGLFSSLAIEPLAERLVESLCLETRAQGGVLWILNEDAQLDLTAARGLVRVDAEVRTLDLSGLPEALVSGQVGSAVAPVEADSAASPALFVALHRDGRVIGVARLTDKLEGEEFDDIDRVCAQKIARHGEIAVANALRFQALERRSIEDPFTGAYTFEYFRDVVRNEIEKANRFGRTFALLRLDLGPVDAVRSKGDESDFRRWLRSVGDQVGRLLRATDLLAADGERGFYALLAEADALGASVLKRRALHALEESELFPAATSGAGPVPRIGLAVYPGDGTQLETMLRAVDARLEEEIASPVAALGLEDLSLDESLRRLLEQGSMTSCETVEEITRFVVGEVGRRPRERALLFAAPGPALSGAVRDGLEMLRGIATRTDLVVIDGGERPSFVDPDVTWVAPENAPSETPFVIHYGDGPAYALVRDAHEDNGQSRFFHTGDRSLVEHLAFRLQRELAMLQNLWPEVPA